MARDEWKKPAAPPPPLFFGKKERDLVKQVNDELIEKVIGYGEAVEKTFLPPVRVYALVEFTDYSTDYLESAGIDKTWEINVHFHKRRLEEDQDMYIREGDFVLYGDFYYEIVKLSEPRKLFGQVDHGFEISARCRRARKGLFDAT